MATDIKTAIYRFCNYQERSQQEVKDRLYELGAYPTQVAEIIAELIEVELLNEERFAKAFVRGKFNLKRWGRIKIIQHLKAHRISDYLLKKSMKEIDPSAYFATALRLAEKKWESLSGDTMVSRKAKVYRYLQSKGYESPIISEVIKEIIAGGAE